MSGIEEQSERRWAGRPRVARLLRFVVWLLPIVVSVASTHFVSRSFPRPAGLWPAVGWFVGLCVLATAILVAVDKLARRLLPLAALLQLSLVFPDNAPSRFKTALRTQTVHQLEMRVAEIKKSGLSNDPAIAAETLIELIAALSQHDRMTRGHAERVRAYSRMIGEEMKLPEADLDLLQWAGLAHDVGKLFIPGEILNKTSRLTDDEFDIIKMHPGWGAELCEPLRPWLGDWVNAVGQHHERWDGNGYPNGLAGTDISLAARIVSVADVFDVITSIRSYKAAGTSAEAREELAKCAGSQFDERVVRAFLNISLGRLRLAMGPLSWMAQVPIVAQMPLVPVVGAAASMVVAGGAMLVGGTFAQAETAKVPVAEAAPLPETTLPPPLPSTTTPLVIVVEESVPPPLQEPTTTVEPTISQPTTTSEPDLVTTTSTTPETTTPPVTTATTPTTPTTTTTTPTTTTTTTTTTTAPLAPLVAPNRAVVVNEDGTIDIDLGEGSGPGLVAQALTAPANGIIERRSGTSFAFTPDGDFNGQTTFDYELRDALGRTSAGSVVIDVLPVPDDPRATNDIAAVAENGSVVIAVLSNDSDPDGGSIRIVSVLSADGAASTDGTTILYVPARDTFGTHQIAYIIENDSGRRDRGVVSVAVSPVNRRPVLVNPGPQSIAEQSTLSFVATASDVDVPANRLTFSLVDGVTPVPVGASIDPDTGVFSWTPTESQGATSYSFKVRVTDDGVPSLFDESEVTFLINEVNEAPVLSPIGNRATDEGTAMSFALSASDADIPANGLTFSASGLPAGASLDPSTGAFLWTPTEAQGGLGFSVTFTVTDDGVGAMSDSESVVLSAVEVNTAPVLVDPGGQTGDEGALLSFVATATDVDVPAATLTFTVVDGVTPVPPGAAIDPVSGVFSWVPTESQGGTSYSFKVRVTDDGVPSLFDESEVTFLINEVNEAPVLSPIGNRATDEGTAMSFALSASDADIPANGLTFSASGLPAGASLDPSTGAFLWTPSEAQGGLGFSVTFTVTDNGAGALFDDEVVVLTATEINQAPTLTNPGDQFATVGGVVSLNITASDVDLPVNGLEFGATGLPAGLSIDTATGVISGTPTTIGSTVVTIAVTETDGSPTNLTDSVTFNWSITPVNIANIVISEIATSGPGGETDEFIELYNPTSSSISIAGWELRRSDGNMSFELASVVPAGVSIGANEYFLISHASVRVALGADAWYTGGQLQPGAGVALFTNLGVKVDAVGTGPVPWKDGSGSLYGEGTYLPPMSGTVAQSYERKSGVGNCVDTDSNAADFFHNMGSRNPQGSGTTATCGTPTPPTPPPPPSHLVISEFRFDGPNGGSDEFVEIFNPTSLPIPLLGYELRNQSGVGPAEAVITLADLARLGKSFIGPGEHLVFGSADYDNGPTMYGKVDIRTRGDIKNGGGVYLVAPAIPLVSPATVVDAVSTGGSVYREGNPLPPITGRVIHSYERRLGAAGGNCVDTDNNIADFFHNLGSENPQKLSAPATTCPP